MFRNRISYMTLAMLVVLTSALAAPRMAAAIDVERVVSPGGIEAWLVRDHSNPIVTMNFAFRGGAGLDPKGKEGLANMVASTLDEGAGDMDSQTVQGTLEDLAIRMRFTTGKDTFRGRLQTLVKNQDTAFRLLHLALTAPRFDEEPVERIRDQILVGLKRDLEDPDSIASLRLFEVLFPDHPYGRPTDGTLESVNRITAADLKAFASNRLAKDNLMIGVVGDVTAERLETVLDRTFGALPDNAEPWELPEVKPATRGQTIVIEKAVPQSTILFADEGLKRKHPDYYAAYVMNHILGGGSFTSRLYQEVREKRGLVYSVGTSLYPYDHTALFFASAGTANERVGETLSVFATEWDRMASSGVTEDELADAKAFLTGSFPLRFTSSRRIAGILVGMQVSDLGIDYLDKRNGFIEAVTLKDIERVSRNLLRKNNLVTVIVGKPDGVSASN